MAILNHGSTIRTADGGQSTTTIVTASNIGSYAVASNATYYIGTTQNVFNRASGAQTLTGVSIDGNAANITAYTINQNLGTSNAPSFAGMTSTGMLTSYTNLSNNYDWQNSPISIRERGLVSNGQSSDIYSPSLNFHWAMRWSSSLWMNQNGNLNWGGYSETGVPSNNGVFRTGEIYVNTIYDKNDSTYYLDPANSGTSLLVAGKVGIGATSPGYTLTVNGTIAYTPSVGNPVLIGNDATYSTSGTGRYVTLGFGGLANSANKIFAHNMGEDGLYICSATSRSIYFRAGGGATDHVAITSGGNLGIATVSADTNLQVVGHVHVGNQTTFENTGGWNKTIYLDGAVHARMRILGSAFASGKNSATETSIWVDNSVAPYSGLDTNAGSFRINAGFTTMLNSARSPIFYDSDDTAYYVDPNSVSRLSSLRVYSAFDTASSDVYANMRVIRDLAYTDGMYIGYGNAGSGLTRIFGGGATTGELSKYSNYTLEPGSFRSPIFYDSDNTAYYIDAASTSVLNAFTGSHSGGSVNVTSVNGAYIGVNNTTNTNGYGISLYNGASAGEPTYGLMFQGTGTFGTHGSVTGDWATYFTMNNDNSRGWIFRKTGGGGNTASISAGGIITASGDIRAPIFYDSGNTAYYCDPNSTSNFVGLTVANTITGSISGNAATASNATQFGGESNTNFLRGLSSGTEANINNYTDNGFRIVSYTGHSKGLLSFTPGGSIGTVQHEYFYGIPTNGWRVRNKTDNTTWSAWGNVVMTDTNQGALTGTVITTGNSSGLSPTFTNLYANVFYDQNDSAYYLDPASTTLSLKTRGYITINNATAPNNLAMLNIGSSGSGETRAIDISGGWSGNENKSITFTHATGSTNIVAQINAQHNGPGSKLRWGKLYHGGDSSTYTMELISESTTSAYLTVAGSVRSPIFYDSGDTNYYLDPAGTSRLNTTRIGNINVGSGTYLNTITPIGDTNINLSAPSGAFYFDTFPRMPGLYDSDNTAYYLDPASTSLLNGTRNNSVVAGSTSAMTSAGPLAIYSASSPYISFHDGGVGRTAYMQETGGRFYFGEVTYTESEGSFRAPLFYDVNDTNYYVDPASSSVLNFVRGTNFYDGTGTYNVNLGSGNTEGRGLVAGYSGGSYGGIGYNVRHTTTGGSWIAPMADTSTYLLFSNGVYFYYAAGGTAGRTLSYSTIGSLTSAGIFTVSGDSRAPIFYDSNNTSYYLDPNSGSNLYDLTLSGAHHVYLTINPGNNYEAMVRYIGGTGSSWYVGKRTSAQLVGTANFHFYSEAAGATVGGIDTSGNIYSIGSVRSPIFYDSDNTGYYIDAASTSNLNILGVAGRAGIGGAGSRSTNGLTVGFTDNSTFAANNDVGDTDRMLSIVNESSTTNAMAVLGFRVNPNGGTANAMLDVKFVQTGATNTSALHYTFNHGGTFADRLTILSSGNIGVGTSDFSYTINDNSRLVGSNTNNKLFVNGSIQLLSNNDAIVIGRGTATFLSDEELGFGWGGGWYMTDGTYLRVRNDKVLYSAGEIWGSIFKDSNDTTYYLNPADVSYLYEPRMAYRTLIGAQSYDATLFETPVTTRPGVVVRGSYPHIEMVAAGIDNSTHGATLRFVGYDTGGATTGNFKHWVIGCPATNLTGLYFGYSPNQTNPHYGIGRGWSSGNDVSIFWILNDREVYAENGVRATIFYDRNNTSYYVDPASTSNLLGLTVANTITGSVSGNAATATNVAWTGITGGARTNYDLQFQPSAGGYSGFAFKTSSAGEAGYFLIRATSDTDVYTAEGITLVADAGWLTLAQRTTASKGVRIMTGTTSSERFKITTAGDVQIVNGNTFTYNGNVVLHSGNVSTYAFAKSGSWAADLVSNYGYTRETGMQMTGGSEFVVLSKSGQGFLLVDGSYFAAEAGGFYSTNNSSGGTLLGFYSDTTTSLNFNTTAVKLNGNQILHAGNYNSYAPTLTGTGASGTWSISISGNSATTTLATKATRANGNFYIDDNYGNTVVGLYAASRYQGVFAMGDSYKLPADGTTTGNLYGIAWSHPNAGGAAGNLSTHGALILENGSYIAAISSSIRCTADMRTPIYYDSNDTAYYIDPNGSSSLFNVIATEFYARNWFRNDDSGEGIYNQTTTQHFYSDDTSYWNVASSSGVQGIRLRTGGYAGTVRGYFYANNSNDVGLLNNSGNWRARVVGGDYFLADGSSIRGQIFYDSNDTNYYCDPNGTSSLAAVNANAYYPHGGITESDIYARSLSINAYHHGDSLTYDTFQFNAASVYETRATVGSSFVSSTVETSIFRGDRFGGMTIANNVYQVRWTWNGTIGYRFFKTLYISNSTNGNSFTVTIESSANGSTWTTIATTGAMSNWPGHSWYNYFWNNNATIGYIRITVTPTWVNANTMDIYSMRYFCSYALDAGARLYDWDYNRNVTFPAFVDATQFRDTNNTAYYIDAASTSNLVGLTVANTITGSVSGNAVTAGGLAVHSGRNNEVNKIVRTDSDGYIQAGWINTTSGNEGTTAIDRVYASYDGFIRYYTPANFRTVLDVPTRDGSGASGSWGISVTGSSASCTGNSATATILATARTIGGVSFNGSANIDLPGVNTAGNQNTSGNAATVTNGVYTGTTNTLTGTNLFQSNLGTTSGSLSSPPLQAYATGTNAAFMSFHRAGSYAVNMGLDSDNVLRIGGWSAAANRLQLDMSGNLTVAGAMYGTNFIDSDNTAYFCNPASTSNLVGLTVANTITGSISGSSASCTGNAATATTLQTARTLTIGSTGKTFNGSANVSWSLAEIGALPLAGGTMTGAISTNVSGTSIFIGNQNVSTSNALRINWHTDADLNYFIGKRGGAWTQPMDIAFYTGIKYHANSTYNAHIFYVGGFDTTEAFSIGKGDNHVRVNNYLYAPLMYDTNDTAFYCNPGGNSIFNTIKTNNVYGGNASVTAASSTTINTAYNLTELTMAAFITTLTFSNIQSSGTVHMWTIVTLGNGSATSVTWPAAIKWPGGTAPNITGTNTKRDIYQFVTYDGGTNIYAIIVGQNL